MSRHTEALAGYKDRLVSRIVNLNPGLANDLKDIRLPWYHITNEADPVEGSDDEEKNPQVYIYDEIGGSFGVSAADFVAELNGITAKKIDVRINSPGGSLFDAIAIYSALASHPAYITTYVDSLAASAASIVALGGDETVMMVGSQMMVHDALGMEFGNAKDMRAMATFLDKQSDNIASMYAAKAGGELEEWRARMLAETWMMANEAVELGLANRVYIPSKTNPSDMPEEMPDEEEEMPEEEDSTKEDDEEDIDVEALMHRRHNLSNRGFKYAGVTAARRKGQTVASAKFILPYLNR